MGRMALTPRSKSVDIEKFGWSEILSNDFLATDDFKNGIFLVGLTVSGVASHQSTAMDPTQLPLHNHLFVLQDLEEGRNLKVWPWLNFFLILWVAFLIVFFVIQKPISYFLMSLFGTISVVFLFSISFLLWRNDFLWIPQSEIAVLFTGSLIAFLRRSSDEERQKNALRKSFGTYLHPSIVKNLMEQSSEVKLGGEERELTLLFSDLRNFTSLSEKVSSKELVSIMNEYFTIVTKHIQESGGTVDKFIGDAVMAFWNAPLSQESHSEKALIAVEKIRKDFHFFSLKWGKRLNLPEGISLGIGLHTGNAIVGNIGGDNRFNYTALGDNVNLASRLEGICKVYSVDIILSLDLISSLSEESRKKWIEIDTIQVKGQSKDVVIFTENNLSEEQSRHWEQMLVSWRLGDVEDVKSYLLNISKSFGPVNTFIHRLDSLHTFPPNWRGSWRMSEK
jgi:adenylate cyclase